LSENQNYAYFDADSTPASHEISAIIVIGESARRDRHGLFGYHHETTPNMSKRKKELLVFNQANSSSSQTVLSVPSSLTSTSIQNVSPYSLQKNIVNLINQAGWQTEWLSRHLS
jgi:glucan phosphoethanolaminetransferase (alkaline phosphatase superfamily)